jgi:hypothetical protein
VQRSDANFNNLFKIGLTRVGVTERAKQLSYETTAALPFQVVAEYRVGNCGRVEAEVHSRLAPYRLNERREFFHCELKKIIRVLQDVVEETEADIAD